MRVHPIAIALLTIVLAIPATDRDARRVAIRPHGRRACGRGSDVRGPSFV